MPDQKLNMVDMAREADAPAIKEIVAGDSAAPQASPEPRYPYGLRVNLEQPELAKLGVNELPRPGARVYIQAFANVIEVAQNDETSEEGRKRVSLQIVEMGIGQQEQKRDASEVIYGQKVTKSTEPQQTQTLLT